MAQQSEQKAAARGNVKAADSEAALMLPGDAVVTPLSQGDCDRLCGLYAIVNGLRLALAPVRPLDDGESRDLFCAGLEYLEREGKLGRTLQNGMPIRLWHPLASHLRWVAEQQTGIPLFQRRLFADESDLSRRTAFARLEGALRLGHVPLLLVIGRARHYTALTGYDANGFSTADSAYLHHIYRRECRIAARGRARLRLQLNSIIAIYQNNR